MGNKAGPSLPLSLHFIFMYEQPVWRKCLLETRLAEAAELYSVMVPSKLWGDLLFRSHPGSLMH